jgi:hypothetical protein
MEWKCHRKGRQALFGCSESAEHIPRQNRFLGLNLLVEGLTFSMPVFKKFDDFVDEAGTCVGRRLLMSAGPAVWQALETPDLPQFNVPHRSR